MFGFDIIGAFATGFVAGAIVLYFVFRNNKAKAIELLSTDIKGEIDELLDKTELDDKVIGFFKKLKDKL